MPAKAELPVRGLIVAAPASGQGKTTITLGLLRALTDAGVDVGACKVGPDYIDPGFHARALKNEDTLSRTVDLWAMSPGGIAREIAAAGAGRDLVIAEGMMGLFDGAGPDGSGSAADLAARTGWPVVLVIDAGAQAASAAAVVRGFATHHPDVRVAGVIFNKVGSDGHGALLREACAAGLGDLPEIPVLGWIVRDTALDLPERHLGLVLAGEHPDLDTFLARAGAALAKAVNLEALAGIAVSSGAPSAAAENQPPLPPLGQRIAVARDAAFAFTYPHVLDGWRAAGAEIGTFSPLGGEVPGAGTDAVFLPGGYPELHAGRLAAAPLLPWLREAAGRGCAVYGECGGYMVMGRGLVDADGTRHRMAGLLPVETSFATPRQHFGYRQQTLAADCLLGKAGATWRGHEFHHAAVVSGDGDQPLFHAADAAGRNLGAAGAITTPNVAGSFMHIIDKFS